MVIEPFKWSTQSASCGALPEWNNKVRSEVGNVRFDTDRPEAFAAAITRRDLGSLSLTAVYTSACRAIQETACRSPLNDQRFSLHYIREGRLAFEQGNRLVVGEPGDFVLIDTFRSYQLWTSTGVRCVSLDAPEAWLKSQLSDPFSCLMTPVDRMSAWARMFGMMLSSIADTEMGASSTRQGIICEQAGGLMTLLFDKHVGNSTTHRSRMKDAILEVLRSRYTDLDITPAGVARHVGISKRSLHLTLADAGTTFGKELSALRLNKACKLLADQDFGSLSIAEIAWRCGFEDPSYFTRCFSRHVGCSPKVYRLEHSSIGTRVSGLR